MTFCLALAAAALVSVSLPAQAQTPDAAAIMARVAANQDRSEGERAHYVYAQHAKVVARKGTTVRCEEITDTRVTPTATGSQQLLLKLDGRLLTPHNRYVSYAALPVKKSGDNTDAGEENSGISISSDSESDRTLVETMRDNFTNGRSKDGIGAGLFPLTSKTQADYAFHLIGEEKLNGRDVFHIAFQPKDRSDFSWKGDAYIDTSAYQPVLVRTAMSRKMPFAVRTLLGTSVPGLGFTVIYAPQKPDGIWFPTSFGTEFKIKVLFFYSREITLEAANRDFERTHVNSTILQPAPAQPETPR